MLIKRSVSPDGRIDSLSIEFSVGVTDSDPKAVQRRAERVLGLQAAIAAGFKKANGGNGGQPAGANNGNGAPLAAQLLGVRGMADRYNNGRRLYLDVSVEGRGVIKFFGSQKQLAEALTGCGQGHLAGNVYEGLEINAPCRAVTKPSQDGRYTNVERLLPAHEGRTA